LQLGHLVGLRPQSPGGVAIPVSGSDVMPATPTDAFRRAPLLARASASTARCFETTTLGAPETLREWLLANRHQRESAPEIDRRSGWKDSNLGLARGLACYHDHVSRANGYNLDCGRATFATHTHTHTHTHTPACSPTWPRSTNFQRRRMRRLRPCWQPQDRPGPLTRCARFLQSSS